MALNLSPQIADATAYDGEGGAYYAWTAAKSPVLSEAALGAGKLVLQPRGFALPHYADTFKIGYVVQGTCTVGLVLPNSPQEKVIIINGGDAIPVPMGSISWWFNGGDSNLTIIFLGESKQSHNPGKFDYFFLTGALGVLRGFSNEFISKIYNLNEADSEKLAKSRTEALILKLGEEINMPGQPNCNVKEYAFNLVDLICSNDGSPGVACAAITADNLGLLDKVGLSASLVRVGPNSVLDPSYTTDGSHRVIYVIKGSGRVQIVGLNGALALDAEVGPDQLFVVPKFFAAALLADEHGLELYSVYTSSRPVLGQLAGNTSPWKALSLPVLQASLNVSPAFVQLFKSNNEGEKNYI
ncbi:11s globulin seed storage protein 2 [Phtheirospermum japonicum]|uniref:11s globulin seed storage protein 2 n=1 Tax=Phtheirospermum japonicum TaxID=374723 RepID=A0A830CP08_9LAMI|nr:11s globulin seed storage protein 2 [Phtheirospermum japonicum]